MTNPDPSKSQAYGQEAQESQAEEGRIVKWACFAQYDLSPGLVTERQLALPATRGESAMRKFLKDQPVVFEPEVIEILVSALDGAWADVQASTKWADGHVVDAREILAKRIIARAKDGERDQSRLMEDAIAYLAKTVSARAT